MLVTIINNGCLYQSECSTNLLGLISMSGHYSLQLFEQVAKRSGDSVDKCFFELKESRGPS